jgi:hypothetical protein
MRKKWLWSVLAALPLVFGGLVYANLQAQADGVKRQNDTTFVCPITGEDLPCRKCCPLD